MGGHWQDLDVQRDLLHSGRTAAARENASTAGRVEAERGGTPPANPSTVTPYQLRHSTPLRPQQQKQQQQQ